MKRSLDIRPSDAQVSKSSYNPSNRGSAGNRCSCPKILTGASGGQGQVSMIKKDLLISLCITIRLHHPSLPSISNIHLHYSSPSSLSIIPLHHASPSSLSTMHLHHPSPSFLSTIYSHHPSQHSLSTIHLQHPSPSSLSTIHPHHPSQPPIVIIHLHHVSPPSISTISMFDDAATFLHMFRNLNLFIKVYFYIVVLI